MENTPVKPRPITGNIPKILRRCTPVLVRGYSGVVSGVSGDGRIVDVYGMEDCATASECEVDTSDATGRLHLAWWMRSHPDGFTLLRCDQRAYRLYKKSIDGHDMTDEEREQLADFVRLLAARPSLAQTGEPT